MSLTHNYIIFQLLSAQNLRMFLLRARWSMTPWCLIYKLRTVVELTVQTLISPASHSWIYTSSQLILAGGLIIKMCRSFISQEMFIALLFIQQSFVQMIFWRINENMKPIHIYIFSLMQWESNQWYVVSNFSIIKDILVISNNYAFPFIQV